MEEIRVNVKDYQIQFFFKLKSIHTGSFPSKILTILGKSNEITEQIKGGEIIKVNFVLCIKKTLIY